LSPPFRNFPACSARENSAHILPEVALSAKAMVRPLLISKTPQY
jgi:hypothetical protein